MFSYLSYLISKVFGTSSRRAGATATSCLAPKSCLSPPPPSHSLPTPSSPPFPKLPTGSTEYSESEDLLTFSPKTTEYSDLVKNIPCLIPTKVENANYADTFDSRIITTVSAVSSKPGILVEKGKARKRKNVRFDLSANTLHKYDWSTLGHENFPERLTDEEKYACMLQYKPAILYRYPNCPPECWVGYLGQVEYSYLSYEEEMAKEIRQRDIEANARILMWGSSAMLTFCSVLMVICLLNPY